jgi:peptidoglycan biosynthesis protein MviN/MurJ (putative lipid II flippase)
LSERVPAPARQRRAPLSSRSLLAGEANAARSSLAVSAGFLVTSLLGGGLAILIVVIVGEGPDTDAFFAAYSIYLFFVVFGSTLRVAVVPLLGSVDDEDAWRTRATGVLARLLGVAAVATGAVVVLSPLLGPLVTPGLPRSARVTAAVCLAILALASFCQMAAAALASALAAARRFPASAVLYVSGAALTLTLGSVLMLAFGVIGAAIGVLGGSAALLVGHVAYLRQFAFHVLPAPRAVRERATWVVTALAAAGAAIALSQQLQLTIALAAISSQIGAVTAYTYGSFVATLLASVTIYVVGFVMLPGVLATLDAHGERAALGYLDFAVPVAFYLYLPAAAAYATFGKPIVEAVLGGSLNARSIDLLWDCSRIFLLMNLSLAILAPASAILLALRRYRAFVLSGSAIVLLHAVGVAIASTSGPMAVAAVHASLAAGLAIPLLGMGFGWQAAPAVARAVRLSLPAAVLALVFPALALLTPTPSGLVPAAALATAGLLVYGVIGTLAWPSVGGRTLRLLLSRA